MSKAFAFQVPLTQFGGSYSSVSAQKNFAASVINAYPIPYVVLGYTGIGQPGGGSNEVDFVCAVSGGSHAQNSALAGSSPSRPRRRILHRLATRALTCPRNRPFLPLEERGFRIPRRRPVITRIRNTSRSSRPRETVLTGRKTTLRATCSAARGGHAHRAHRYS